MTTQMTTTNGSGGAGTQLQSIDDLPMARAIGELKEKFAAALPKDIPVERFMRVALLALTDAKVASAAASSVHGRRSVYDALLRAATDGLLVDKREAALVTYSTKIKVPNDNGGVAEKWFDLVQFQPMVAGIRKKARNSGEISDIICQCVYALDVCEIDFNKPADQAPVTHKIDPRQADRGAFLGAYAYLRLKDGTYSQPEWMSKAQIDRIMQRTKSQKDGEIFGPWKTDYDEMARKTVIKRASKSWPSSSDRDGRLIEDLIRVDDNLIDLTPDQPTTPALPRKQPTAAKMLTQELQGGKQPDPAGAAQDKPKEPTGGDGGNPPDDFTDV